MRGNGLAACYDEKINEDSDYLFHEGRKRKGNRGGEAVGRKRQKGPPKRGNETDHEGRKRKAKKRESESYYQIPSRLNTSTILCIEEQKLYKTNIIMEMEPYFQEVKR